MIADYLNNQKRVEELYLNLENGDKIMSINSKEIGIIIDDPPIKPDYTRKHRLVLFSGYVIPVFYSCYSMIYDDKFQKMKVGDLVNIIY